VDDLGLHLAVLQGPTPAALRPGRRGAVRVWS
jgi:hypothetical protein